MFILPPSYSPTSIDAKLTHQTNSDIQPKIVEYGGLSTLFKLLHSPRAHTQRQAARALANLSANRSLHPAFVREGGIGKLMMMATPSVTAQDADDSIRAEIQLLAAQSLANLASLRGMAQSW